MKLEMKKMEGIGKKKRERAGGKRERKKEGKEAIYKLNFCIFILYSKKI